MTYNQFIKYKKPKLNPCSAILLSLAMLSPSAIFADQIEQTEQNERKNQTNQYNKHTLAKPPVGNNVMLGGFLVDSLVGLVKSGLGEAAGAGFNYLMRENGLDPTYNKLLQIIDTLESMQKDLDMILENQKVLKTFISDSFYNLHMVDYDSALTRSYYALTFEQGKKQNLQSYQLTSDTGEGLRQIERLYQLFFKDNVGQDKKDFSSEDLIVYVEKNLVNKTNDVNITQENIDAIQSVKNTMLYKLKADYLPTEIQKNVLVAALNSDMSVDIARSIKLINNQVSSVGLAYASFLQKAVMVSQVLAVLKEKDEKYNDYYLGDIYANKSLTEGLAAEKADSEQKVSEFLQHIKTLYVTDTTEIIKNIANINISAGAPGKIGTMEEAKKYCEIVSFVPTSSAITVECASGEPSKREDYKFRFAANLGPLYTNSHVSANVVNFTYGDGVTDDKRFTFNYNNPVQDRDTAKQYFSEGKEYTPITRSLVKSSVSTKKTNVSAYHSINSYTDSSLFNADKSFLEPNISIYPVLSEEHCEEIRPLPYAPTGMYSCEQKGDILVHFKNTGNFVYIKGDGSENPYSSQYKFYIGTTKEDIARLKQTLLPPLSENKLSVQQAFNNGAVLQLVQDKTFLDLGFSMSVHAYNPLRIETNLEKGKKAFISLQGDWLQYCDRSDSTLTPISKDGAAGWELQSLCHADIDKADDFNKTSVFINKERIKGSEQVLTINYLPTEGTLDVV